MGHKGDIEARYSTNKGRLPSAMIEEMRKAYRMCTPFLATREEPREEQKIKRAFREQFLLIAGYRKDEVEKIDLDEIWDEKLQKLIRERLGITTLNSGQKQKVIPVSEVKAFIERGYEYVASLPDGQVIVKTTTK